MVQHLLFIARLGQPQQRGGFRQVGSQQRGERQQRGYQGGASRRIQ